MKLKYLFIRLKNKIIKNSANFWFFLKLSLSLNKYFNFFNFLFIIWIKPLDLDLFNSLIEEVKTDKEGESVNKINYKWWLEKIIFVAVAAVGIYVLYKAFSTGSGPDVVSTTIGSANSNVRIEPVVEEDPFISLLDKERYEQALIERLRYEQELQSLFNKVRYEKNMEVLNEELAQAIAEYNALPEYNVLSVLAELNALEVAAELNALEVAAELNVEEVAAEPNVEEVAAEPNVEEEAAEPNVEEEAAELNVEEEVDLDAIEIDTTGSGPIITTHW